LPTLLTNTRPPSRRTRDGCWTCRSRKKKCGSDNIPCPNCARLGLKCERETRLVWEDDTRRTGMRRRGPARQRAQKKLRQPECSSSKDERPSERRQSSASMPPYQELIRRKPRLHGVSTWPFELDNVETRLLDHYIQRFSREYPTCSGPTNPFLRIFLPLSMESRTVLDALLALSGVQSWENGGFVFPKAMLKLRQRALRGCVDLTSQLLESNHDSKDNGELSLAAGFHLSDMNLAGNIAITQQGNFLRLLASCVLLLLYEKLAGEGERNGSPHLHFFARMAPSRLVLAITSEPARHAAAHPWGEAYRFLSSLFFYNDLVQSTSLGTPTLSQFYLGNTGLPFRDCELESENPGCESGRSRFFFPHLIARISSGDLSVTEANIAAWDGRLDWFPSYALFPPATRQLHQRLPIGDRAAVLEAAFRDLGSFTKASNWSETAAISELYRAAATIYKKQCALRRLPKTQGIDDKTTQMGNLPSWAAQLLAILTPASPFDNALLWPIGIFAKELTASHRQERDCVINKLESLERRFKMKHFCCVRQHLLKSWAMKDIGLGCEDDEAILLG
ncbi:fungal-specific transcription factor domain-containing protein, partial [Thelonectria olida]